MLWVADEACGENLGLVRGLKPGNLRPLTVLVPLAGSLLSFRTGRVKTHRYRKLRACSSCRAEEAREGTGS